MAKYRVTYEAIAEICSTVECESERAALEKVLWDADGGKLVGHSLVRVIELFGGHDVEAAAPAEDEREVCHCGEYVDDHGLMSGHTAIAMERPPEEEPDCSTCPGCGGEADNGNDRSHPPGPYYCSKCDPAPPESEE